jgi:hypothetical protein
MFKDNLPVLDVSVEACRERISWLETQIAQGRDLGPALDNARKELADALKRSGKNPDLRCHLTLQQSLMAANPIS